VNDRPSAERVAAHLVQTYDLQPGRCTALDHDVYRFQRDDGPSWVARVFPVERTPGAVAGDAEILRLLEPTPFPAERCAHDEPVSVLDGNSVLVTEFVDGSRPERGGRIFAVLGALLGALHARPGDGIRAGGGWHHLTPQGGPRDEIYAAIDLLERRIGQLAGNDAAQVDELLGELDATADCDDLPQCFVHPDFVPLNAIATPDGGTTIVDWAGAGRGPRIWSLGFLLYATGGHPKLIELVMSRYRRRIDLEPEELAALRGVLQARPLLLDCWAVGHGRKKPADAVRALSAARGHAATIASAVMEVLAD
jgi:Ser/Thr protein kinase RdoA (MazF antagonist)